MLAFFKTHCWRLLFLCVCFVATMLFSVRLIGPKVILELPEDSADERLMGQGFTEDSAEFLITRFNTKTLTRNNTEAWNIQTKQSSPSDGWIKSPKRFNWKWYTPLGLDDLTIKYDVVWEIRRKDETEPLAYYHDLERPFLARQSPDGRFIATESMVGMVHVIDTTKRSSLWKIPDEGIVQFSNYSQYLFTSYKTASGNHLNCWNLAKRQLQWTKSNTRVKSVKTALEAIPRQPRNSIADPYEFAEDLLYPLSFSSTQVLFWTQMQEWTSPLADWLVNHHWLGVGSGTPWNKLSVFDLSTGNELNPGPKRSLIANNTYTSRDGTYLAINVTDTELLRFRWLIYALPFKPAWLQASVWGLGVTSLFALWMLWHFWRRKVVRSYSQLPSRPVSASMLFI